MATKCLSEEVMSRLRPKYEARTRERMKESVKGLLEGRRKKSTKTRVYF